MPVVNVSPDKSIWSNLEKSPLRRPLAPWYRASVVNPKRGCNVISAPANTCHDGLYTHRGSYPLRAGPSNFIFWDGHAKALNYIQTLEPVNRNMWSNEKDRWDPAELGPVIHGLLAKARPKVGPFGQAQAPAEAR